MTIQDENIRLKKILKDAIWLLKEIEDDYFDNEELLFEELGTNYQEMYQLEIVDDVPFTDDVSDYDDDGSLYWKDVE